MGYQDKSCEERGIIFLMQSIHTEIKHDHFYFLSNENNFKPSLLLGEFSF